MTQSWRLDTRSQTLLLGADAGQMARVVYWGARLPGDEDAAALAAAGRRDVTGGMLDTVAPLDLCPLPATGFQGQPGLVLRDAVGVLLAPEFSFERAEEEGGSLALIHRDTARGLTYTARFSLPEGTDVIVAEALLSADDALRVDWLAAPVMPGPEDGGEIRDYTGRWCGEFQPVQTPWQPGIRMRESLSGRTGHETPPFAILSTPGTTNSRGLAFGLAYGWSGGHRMIAEELSDGRRQVQMGHAGRAHLPAARTFASAPLVLAASGDGLNGVGAALVGHVRHNLLDFPEAALPRPVHYNCWEAVYFDHDLDRLKQIASRAASLGAERFVLDDGWFGRRDDDRSSLGDWRVDPRKYPDGLAALVDHVRSEGMGFGIWFEPEMVNPDSDLFRAHPDWALGPADQPLGRHQMVLDMSRQDVRDHLFDALSAILSGAEISYVKWDHNRVLPVADPAQAAGTYALLERLRAAHPGVEFESCASGGGRIDYGILERCTRVWLSDSNDALERLRIQHEAALFLPMEVTGSHVGPRVCHTSGRILPMAFRAWVAASRHMGFEMDPMELTDDEAETLRAVTSWWKANRDWMCRATIHRLDSMDPQVIAEAQVAERADRFVAFVGQTGASAQVLPRPVRLAGLDPARRYEVRLRNPHDRAPVSRGAVALDDGPLTLSGAALMAHGVQLPVAFPATLFVLEGKALP
ncbi:alpha-galactosidase [Oceanomicrobium pacificus]|uniref:alpha-galactosidase n=1 Tax=Oceanomicrobium pacificus TaxID=2692916 RepID=A0A6B0TRX7_9RHOB|nr:alpha-galactosidase [Oceanomicrobium pacificus]MXU64104.1 alpha-galactosidase [Oceanomicrobium pacificus]